MKLQTRYLFYLLLCFSFSDWFTPTDLSAQPKISQKQIACFIAKDFPTVDASKINESDLKQILSYYTTEYFSNIDTLNKKLSASSYQLLVLPYGSAFPLDAWQTIQNFLNSGGGLAYLGGYPFHQPVVWRDSSWVLGIPQQTFARKFLIGPADKIELNSNSFYSSTKTILMNEFELDPKDFPKPATVYEMTVRFTAQKDFKDEDGSSGPREAIMRPLIHLLNQENLPVACPLVEIDRLQGSSAGARWIFSPSDAKLSNQLIKNIIDRALEGAVEFNANPIFASLYNGELPQIRINLFTPDKKDNQPIKIKCTIKNSQDKIVHSAQAELTGINDFKSVTVAIKTSNPLPEGFYSVEIEAQNVPWHPSKTTTGFWVWDKKLAAGAPKLSVSKDWLHKDGKVFPIIGTTYMASDVHRKFLIEPNPFVWEKDFEKMQQMGINFVRSGLWNSWDRVMLDRGAIDESFLRALDAYILTAAKHNIIVCFNLFAFTPPLNGGTNPYLDPRALDWQKIFITLIAKRYKNVGWIHYDLINEPSYTSPSDLWKTAPVNDAYEQSAWKNWVIKKYGSDNATIQNKWRDADNDVFALPNENELNYKIYKENRSPRKGMDFNLFVQDVLTNWADTLNKVIKTTSGALVTLGQDEGGTTNRPAQQFHYDAVDYTSIHTWWLNDDLLWDGLMTKVPEKPNLISETGLMRLEDIDGEPWRSQENASKLLDRKFALGFTGRGAGIVQWAWNINPYMPIDNESAIGFFRPDGTAKFEIQTIKKFSKFFEKIQPKLGDFQNNEIAIVIPHSKIFSGMKNGDLSTKRIVRALADHFSIVPTLISEYKLTPKRLSGVKLVIVPSAEFLDDSAAVQLYRASLNGTKILFTGALEGNAYGQLSENILKLGLINKSVPVSLFEQTNYNERKITVTFDNQQSEFIKKSIADKFYESGNIMHEPLPIELAREKESLILLLKNSLVASGIKSQFFDEPLTTGILYLKDYALIICVNESSNNINRQLTIDNKPLIIDVNAGESKLLLFERQSGKIISETK